ncbi:hypothetical protein J6590_009217 [Homalodisca vitripennis]|nr:hypothetical protein J6590_009217 [Homalodisca vitripennis]
MKFSCGSSGSCVQGVAMEFSLRLFAGVVRWSLVCGCVQGVVMEFSLQLFAGWCDGVKYAAVCRVVRWSLVCSCLLGGAMRLFAGWCDGV